jgi:ABC-type sugar transport system ATPase subunit
LFLDMTIADNIVVAQLEQFGSWWLHDRQGDRRAEEYRQKLRIASSHVSQSVDSLSGGNQQKVMLAKWLLVNPRIMMVDEPTRGIDVGAKAEVHALLHDLSRKGTAIIVISSDLPEVLALADRILVMRDGGISGEMSGHEATEEKVMRLATTSAEESRN